MSVLEKFVGEEKKAKAKNPKEVIEYLTKCHTLAWDLTTTSTTADQEIGSYTPDIAEKFSIILILIEVYYTTLSTTAALLGKLSIYYPDLNEYIVKDLQASNTTSGALFGLIIRPTKPFNKELETIKAICTPATTTSTKWIITIWGLNE